MSEIDPYDVLERQMIKVKNRLSIKLGGASVPVVKDDGVCRHLSFRFLKASRQRYEVVNEGLGPVNWAGKLMYGPGSAVREYDADRTLACVRRAAGDAVEDAVLVSVG
ncbi:hypothetical protein [Streptomyces sp. NPDC059816]|uniref:hypothetical protein n=1 Tax=Streptomyces sp. NPDC059816 TaxID=3346960 RepID=UPI003665427B